MDSLENEYMCCIYSIFSLHTIYPLVPIILCGLLPGLPLVLGDLPSVAIFYDRICESVPLGISIGNLASISKLPNRPLGVIIPFSSATSNCEGNLNQSVCLIDLCTFLIQKHSASRISVVVRQLVCLSSIDILKFRTKRMTYDDTRYSLCIYCAVSIQINDFPNTYLRFYGYM